MTGIPLVELAVRSMLGEKLRDMGYGTGLAAPGPYHAVKVPVFSFEKLSGVDTQLGPEMKSTGEVLGVAPTMEEALYKGLLAAGYHVRTDKGLLICVRDSDKPEIAPIAAAYASLGCPLYATEGTAATLRKAGLTVETVKKIHESKENTMTLLESGKVGCILSTSAKGRVPARDSVKLRRKAVELGVPCLTSLDTAAALASILKRHFPRGGLDAC